MVIDGGWVAAWCEKCPYSVAPCRLQVLLATDDHESSSALSLIVDVLELGKRDVDASVMALACCAMWLDCPAGLKNFPGVLDAVKGAQAHGRHGVDMGILKVAMQPWFKRYNGQLKKNVWSV